MKKLHLFLTDFKYEGTEGVGTVGLGTDFPSKILRFTLSDFENSTLICQRGAYLASNPTVNIEMEFTKNLTTGFFGGQGVYWYNGLIWDRLGCDESQRN